MRANPEEIIDAFVPAGPNHERLAGLARLGQRFADQHRGRRPGVLRRHVETVVERLADRTFEALLTELELDALRHRLRAQTPIVKVDRAEETLIYLDGDIERAVGFRRLRNLAQLRIHANR